MVELLPSASEKAIKIETSKSKGRLQINKETLPLKVVLFLYCGAMAAILPYLTIHMQCIGITIQETAIIYAILPFTSFLGPPLMGFLADKLGQYKTVLILATIANGIFHTLLLAVPIYKETEIRSAVQFHSYLDKAYLLPFDQTECESFGKFLSDDNQNFDIEISSCTTQAFGLPQASENFTEKCQINMPTGRDTYECNPYIALKDNNAENDATELNATKEEEALKWKFQRSLYNDCLLSVNFPVLQEDKNMMITCATNLTFPTGELLIEGNNPKTFWIYFILRIIATIFTNSCFSLLDATTLAVIRANGEAEYGKERIWSVLGFGVVSPIAGLLVDQISRSKGYTDYSAAFYVSDALLILNVLAYSFMKLHVEKPDEGLSKNFQKLMRYPEVVVFLMMIFILGIMWGFVESYLFIFLKELDAPNYLLGLTLTVGSVAGIPFSYGSEKILSHFGRVNIIIFAFIAYFVRFFGYSFITSPFWCFPFEAMEAFTFHTMWIAAATYCSDLAPKGLLATLMGVMGSLHYSLGKGSGAFIGGYMLGAIGTRLTFRYFGVVAGIVGIIYFFINFVWLEKVVRRRHANASTDNSSEDDPEKLPGPINASDTDEDEDDETACVSIDKYAYTEPDSEVVQTVVSKKIIQSE